MRTIKTYFKGAPFYNVFLGTYLDQGQKRPVIPGYDKIAW
jgi:hypothetical protein